MAICGTWKALLINAVKAFNAFSSELLFTSTSWISTRYVALQCGKDFYIQGNILLFLCRVDFEDKLSLGIIFIWDLSFEICIYPKIIISMVSNCPLYFSIAHFISFYCELTPVLLYWLVSRLIVYHKLIVVLQLWYLFAV